MIPCPQCGQENEAGTPLCRECGAKLPESVPQQVQPETASATDAATDEILDVLRSGSKIEAIKRYRERYGVGLKEAKDAVERLGAEHGVVPQGGCAGVLLLAVLGLATGALLLLG